MTINLAEQFTDETCVTPTCILSRGVCFSFFFFLLVCVDLAQWWYGPRQSTTSQSYLYPEMLPCKCKIFWQSVAFIVDSSSTVDAAKGYIDDSKTWQTYKIISRGGLWARGTALTILYRRSGPASDPTGAVLNVHTRCLGNLTDTSCPKRFKSLQTFYDSHSVLPPQGVVGLASTLHWVLYRGRAPLSVRRNGRKVAWQVLWSLRRCVPRVTVTVVRAVHREGHSRPRSVVGTVKCLPLWLGLSGSPHECQSIALALK